MNIKEILRLFVTAMMSTCTAVIGLIVKLDWI